MNLFDYPPQRRDAGLLLYATLGQRIRYQSAVLWQHCDDRLRAKRPRLWYRLFILRAITRPSFWRS